MWCLTPAPIPLVYIIVMKKFFKENWFEIIVIVLLIMCYMRLGSIEENSFYTADVADSSATRIVNTMEDYLPDIERNTANTVNILDNHF